MLEISLNNVSKNYGFKNVLKNLSLEIMSGERVALVGRNGSGKTTALKIITGEEAPTAGSASVRRGATIGYLEQIPALTDSGITTRQILLEPFDELYTLENRLRELERKMAGGGDMERLMRSYAYQQERFEALGGYAIDERVARIVSGFGLASLMDRPFNVLSGGQKTVVTLAKALLRQPDILLLDEPTNHLDIRMLEWFEAFLAKYRGTVVMVSHDRYFLDAVATKTVILEDGEADTYPGNYSRAMAERERRLMIEFEQYKNQQKKIAAMREAIKRYHEWDENNEKFMRKARELQRRLDKMDVLARPRLEKPGLPIQFSGSRTGRDTIALKDVALSAGRLELLRDVNFTVFYKERACLMGDNGSGKTTLIRAILGEITPAAGEIKLAPGVLAGYIPQEIRFDDDTATMLEIFKSEHICTEGQARNILSRYGFVGDNVHKRASALSGGEKVLLKLAILVQRDVNLLVLDEPTNHIDIETREILEEALAEYPATIFFVSHDRYFIRKLATRVLTIRDTTIDDFSGDYETYLWHRSRVWQ